MPENVFWALQNEYRASATAWIDGATQALSRELHPLLAGIPNESMGELPVEDENRVSDDELASPLFRVVGVKHELSIHAADVVRGDVDTFLTLIFEMADSLGTQLTEGMIAHLDEVCEASDQSIDATGRDIFEVLIEAAEMVEFGFDETGNHDLALVLHPDTAERLRDKTPTREQEERLQSVIARKREVWSASRRRQELP
ncbi:MAG: hypothetical protein QME72_01945 [Rhodococcus sp. (in: high G+C Gram-positive bacteria)]|nr:hypothetical protein [Rhodococcus sp. (in: high G+C Gram-positive bacteria)]MDI6626465.1 hypothetical protein [Rhodococcus sp. (in: high G+C Gram-positive bacteria)]